jgi:hypothetical protein
LKLPRYARFVDRFSYDDGRLGEETQKRRRTAFNEQELDICRCGGHNMVLRPLDASASFISPGSMSLHYLTRALGPPGFRFRLTPGTRPGNGAMLLLIRNKTDVEIGDYRVK